MYCRVNWITLAGKCLPGRIQNALNELLETLDETYERILREINDRNWEFARQLILCVAVASRPRVEELAEFLAFEVRPIPKFREDWRLEDPVGAVVSTCSTLLAVVNIIDDFPVERSELAHLRARSARVCLVHSDSIFRSSCLPLHQA